MGLSEYIGLATGLGSVANTSRDARKEREANQRNERLTREAEARTDQRIKEDREFQREFAKHGVQWRVEDAKAAGVHPAFALGASPTQAASTIVGADPGAPTQSIPNQSLDKILQLAMFASEYAANRQNQEYMKSKTVGQGLENTAARVALELQTNEYVDQQTHKKKHGTYNPAYTKEAPLGTYNNPEGLFKYYRDQYTGKIIPGPHEEFAEAMDNVVGKTVFGYGLGQEGVKPPWKGAR